MLLGITNNLIINIFKTSHMSIFVNKCIPTYICVVKVIIQIKTDKKFYCKLLKNRVNE